jgi:hypothetical protein
VLAKMLLVLLLVVLLLLSGGGKLLLLSLLSLLGLLRCQLQVLLVGCGVEAGGRRPHHALACQ